MQLSLCEIFFVCIRIFYFSRSNNNTSSNNIVIIITGKSDKKTWEGTHKTKKKRKRKRKRKTKQHRKFADQSVVLKKKKLRSTALKATKDHPNCMNKCK
uniref:Uncharacterized protein n=1 Tax=Trypanosoma brucei TaxID=5691 RepID=Q581J2_9TRYP|nr:hypothetical protein, unlikely [Trypanosoma brucei]